MTDVDTKPIYERLDEQGESSKWFAKFLIYRNMKPVARSLLAAYNIYADQAQKGVNKRYTSVPRAWLDAFNKYDWKFRAEQYDAHLQAEQDERAKVLRDIEAAEKERILTTGYALIEKRIEGLAAMADLIKLSFVDDEDKEKIKFAWVTPDKIREYRGCLDDIAKELGHRVKTEKREHSGSIEFKTEWGGGVLETDDEA